MKSLVQTNKKCQQRFPAGTLQWIVIQASLPGVCNLFRRDACNTIQVTRQNPAGVRLGRMGFFACTFFATLIFTVFLFGGKVEAQDAGRKKNIKFKYAEKPSEAIYAAATSPIDFDAIYYSMFVDPVFQDTIYDYLRFFPEGQLYRSGNYQQVPTEAEVANENLQKGYHGYYYIEDTVLHMEIYIDRYSDKEYYEATFTDRTITIYKTKTMRSDINMIASVRKDTTVYHKIPMALPGDVKPGW